MANYGYEEGALTSINEIVDKAEENTSTDGSSLGFRSLGNIVENTRKLSTLSQYSQNFYSPE